jgi:hypothetical protein
MRLQEIMHQLRRIGARTSEELGCTYLPLGGGTACLEVASSDTKKNLLQERLHCNAGKKSEFKQLLQRQRQRNHMRPARLLQNTQTWQYRQATNCWPVTNSRRVPLESPSLVHYKSKRRRPRLLYAGRAGQVDFFCNSAATGTIGRHLVKPMRVTISVSNVSAWHNQHHYISTTTTSAPPPPQSGESSSHTGHHS